MKLYPEITPFDTGFLNVSGGHSLYYEQVGNPDGKPLVFLHGGPGGGATEEYRRYFDPSKWRVILFDQRGCGRSRPFASLDSNTTWDLVADIEKLKNHFSINSWSVFGGSWGSTLALSYAQSHPSSCEQLFLRGVFLLRKKEIDWFYKKGASKIFPDYWEKYLEPLSLEERDDPLPAYYKILSKEESPQRLKAAKAWSTWEAATSKLKVNPHLIDDFSDGNFATAFARIECHYFTNKGFFEKEDQLLDGVDKIRHIPTIIVHGRYDVVCPLESAWELAKRWPEAEFKIIEDAGHSLSEDGIRRALMEALNK